MPPNQNQFPAPPPQQPEQNPYDFFMEPQNSGKKPLFSNNGSPMQKIFLFGGAVIVGLILIAVVLAVVMGGNKNDTAPLLGIAQTQQEIIRVATAGAKSTKTSKLQNFAVTAQVTITSSQRELLAHLAKQGIKPKTKDLEVTKNAETDTALAAALAANTYDTTFASTMEAEFEAYTAKLEEAAALATTKTERDLLQKQFTGAELLLKQMLTE